MLSSWHLGNDIVDLADLRHAGKAGNERFLRRVCSEREQEDVLSSEDPDRALWIRWAGKEAAFKTVSKALGTPPIFIHSHFEVTVLEPTWVESTRARSHRVSQEKGGENPGDSSDPPVTRFGEVKYLDFLLPLRIELVGTALHAVTWLTSSPVDIPPFSWGSTQMSKNDQNWKEVLEPEFSPTEWACISHQASALARIAARRSMASTLNLAEEDLEIGCGPGKPGRRIPLVLFRGREIPVDLSLSHHGRLLAWAFLKHPGS